jgi:hypothetical protein
MNEVKLLLLFQKKKVAKYSIFNHRMQLQTGKLCTRSFICKLKKRN